MRSLLLVAGAAAAAVTPVEKVLTLLAKLETKMEEDGKSGFYRGLWQEDAKSSCIVKADGVSILGAMVHGTQGGGMSQFLILCY